MRVTVFRLIRGVLAIIGGVFVLGAGMALANWGGYRLLRYRLQPLYAIASEVRKGMPREQVLRIIQAHDAPYLEKHVFPDGSVTVWVQYALTDMCSTAIGFHDSVLESTRTIGEDSPTDYCPEAPADIR
jgi:hypothetical protein